MRSLYWLAHGAPTLSPTARLKRVVRLARETRNTTRKYARDAAALGGRLPLIQFIEALRVAVTYDLVPDDYYRYALYLVENRIQAPYYFPSRVHRHFRHRLLSHLPASMNDIEDKRLLPEHCGRHGIAVVPTLAEFANGHLVSQSGDRTVLPRQDLFSKQALGHAGRGAMLWIYTGSESWQADSEAALSEGDLFRSLRESSRTAPLILQPRIRNHPAVEPLSSGALCTARIITCRRYDHAPEIVESIFRMPVAHAFVDNYTQGGLACRVDADGVLGPAVSKKLPAAMRRIEHHPISGVRIVGMRLPFWSEAKQMVLAAHKLYPEVPSVGWDVAIATEGVILIEANSGWGVRLTQHAAGRPLGRTPLTACYLSWIAQVADRDHENPEAELRTGDRQNPPNPLAGKA